MQQNRFLALVSNKDLFQQNLNVAENSEDTGTLQALKALDSIESKLNQVQVAYQQFYTNLGVESVWKTLLDGTKNFINSLNSLPKAFGKIPLGAATVVADAVSIIRIVGLNGLALIAKDFKNSLTGHLNDLQTSEKGQEEGKKLIQGFKDGINSDSDTKDVDILNGIIEKAKSRQEELKEIAKEVSNFEGLIPTESPTLGTSEIDSTIWLDQLETWKDKLVELKIITPEVGEAMMKMAPPEASALVEKLTHDTEEMGNKAEEAIQKVNQSKNAKLGGNLSTLGAALNVVSNALDKTSESGRIFSGVLMGAGGALKAVGSIIKYLNTEGMAFPWMAVAMGAITLINAIETIIETPQEKLERLQKQAEDLSNTAKQISASEKSLKSGVEKVRELEQARYDSAEAAEEYQSAVEDLADSFPELIRGFDEAGNVIIDLDNSEEMLATARQKTAQATYDAAKAEQEAAKQNVENQNADINERFKNLYDKMFQINEESVGKAVNSSTGREQQAKWRKIYNDNIPEDSKFDPLIGIDSFDERGITSSEQLYNNLLGRGNYQEIVKQASDYNDFIQQLTNNSSDVAIALGENLEDFREAFGIVVEGQDNTIADFSEIQTLMASLRNGNYSSEEAKNKVKELKIKIKDFNEKNENSPFQGLLDENGDLTEIISAMNSLQTSNAQYQNYTKSTISQWLQLKKAYDDTWIGIEDSDKALGLLSNQLYDIWKEGNYTDITSFENAEKVQQAVTEYREGYGKLNDAQQKALLKMQESAKSYTAAEVLEELNKLSDTGEQVDLAIVNAVNSSFSDGEEQLKRIAGAYEQIEKVQTAKKKKVPKAVEDLKNFIDTENADYSIGETDFIISQLKTVNDLSNQGLEGMAFKLAEQTKLLISQINNLTGLDKGIAVGILNSTNLNTKEGIDEAIEQLQNSGIDESELTGLIRNLQKRRQEIIDNVVLSLNANLNQLLDEAEDDSKLLSKLDSGLTVKEANELIQKAQSWGVKLTIGEDLVPNGDKLVASENAFNEVQKGYKINIEKAAKKAEEDLNKAKEAGLLTESGKWVTIDNKVLTDAQKEFFSRQGLNLEEAIGENGQLTEDGKKAVQEMQNNIDQAIINYSSGSAAILASIFNESNWNKGNYSSLAKSDNVNKNRVTQTGGYAPEITKVFDVDKFNQYLTGELQYDAQTDPNLKAAVEKARGGVSGFLSDLLSKGADNFNASDYAETGIEEETFKKMSADALAVKNGELSYTEFVSRYGELTGESIEEINNLIIQAIQQDNKTSEAAQRKAFSDLTIVGDTITGTEEQINALATALGNVDVTTLLGQEKADGSYEVIITEAVQQALENLDIIKQSIPNQLKDFSDSVSKAADYIIKGSNDTVAMQQFADIYAKALGGKAGDYSWEQLFDWNSNVEAYTLSTDAYFTYIEAQKQKLDEAGAADEEVIRILSNARKQLASNIDIAKYLKSDRREKATNDLKTQLVSYYELIAREETQNLPDYVKKTALDSVELRARQTIAALNEGGAAAVEAYREIIKELEDRDLTAEEVKEAYLSELNQYKDALSELDDEIQVGSIITNDFLRKALEDADFKIDKNGVVTVVGNMISAYHNIYKGMKDSGEATVSELNEAYAKVLETKDGANVISALGDAANMTYTRLGEILASKGIELTDELLAQYSDAIQSIGGGKIRITNFDRFATEIMGWTDIDKNSEEYVSAFKTYNDSLIEMNRKVERNIVEEVQALENAQAGDWINLTQLMNKTDLSMSKLFEKRYFSDFNYTGNVDISKRPIISPEKMKAAGYTDFNGDYATLYSTTISFGDAAKDLADCLDIVATPIQDLNTVLSDEELAQYIESLVENTDGSVEAVLAMDAAQRNLILGMFEGEEILSQANQEYGEKLHEFSEDWVNSNPLEELHNELQNALLKYGAFIEDGILKLSDNTNIPAVMGTLVDYIQEYGDLSVQEEAQLLDTLNANLKSYSDALTAAIQGAASNQQVQQLRDWANSLDIQIDFTKTIDGLKISQDSAIKLYNELKKIDYLQSQLVFKELSDSLKESNSHYKDMSSILARIKDLEKEIRNPDVSTARREEYKRELELAKEIKETRALTDPDSFNFMGNDIPDAMKGAENYWNSWGNAFKAMNEAGETGYMGITDFYNIVNEMNNLAKISGNTLTFMGKELSGDAKDAANLIQEGMGYLANVDGSGVSVSLQKFGTGFAKDAAGMQTNVKAGIRAMADSQIEMLDAMIALMEAVVAMEKLGEVDTDKNGILSVGEIFSDETDDKGNKKFTKTYDKVREYLANSEELAPLLDSLKVNGISLRQLLDDNQEVWRNAGISEDEYAKIMTAFYQASLSDNYDLENLISSVLDVLSGTGQVFSYYDKESGIETVIDASGRTYTVNWNKEEDKKQIYEAFDKAGYNKRPSDEEMREILNRGQAGKSKDQKEIFAYQLTYGLVAECEVDGKTKYQDSDGGIHDTIEEAVVENAFIKQKGEAQGDRKIIKESGKITGYQQTYTLDSGLSYSLAVGVDGKETYSTTYNKESISGNTYQEMIDTLLDKAANETYQGKDFSELASEEQIALKRKLNIETTPEIVFTGADGKEYDPATDPDTQQKLQAFLNQSHEKIQQALEQDGDNDSYTVTLDGSKLTVEAKNKDEAITKIQQAVDPLITSISAGIKSAFTDDDTIGNALVTAITTALSKVSFDGQNFTISDIPVTADKITVDTSKATPVFGSITQESVNKAKDWLESKKSSLSIPNVPVKVDKATYSAPTEIDAKAIIDSAKNTGKDVIAGLIETISDTTAISTAVTNLANSIPETIKAILQIASPSQVTAGIGQNIVDGLVQGLGNVDSAVSAGKSLVQQVIEAIQAYLNANPLTVSANVKASTSGSEVKQKMQTTGNNTVAAPNLSAVQGALSRIGVIATNTFNGIATKAQNIQAAQNAIKTDKVEAIQTEQNKIKADKVKDIQTEQNKIKNDKVKSIQTEQSKIKSDKVKNIQTEQNKIRADKVRAIQTAQNSIRHNKVDDIRIAQNQISTNKIDALKRAINNLSGTVSLGVNISVNVQNTGGAQAKGSLGPWSVSRGNGQRIGDMGLEWSQHNAYAAGKDTLMGELGPELVVSHGRYFLVGQNGPEMVNLDEDAIVFNHLQTKKLIEKGRVNTHGTPVTNEKKAISFATGNFEGPALASASEVLAILKQLREMWRSLRDASMKEIGVNAGKAGKTKSSGSGKTGTDKETKDTEKYTAGIESNVERWYNWLQAIEATQYKINKLAKEYNILEKEGISTQEKLTNLQEQYKLRQENEDTRRQLAEEQKQYRRELIREANHGLMSAFYQADEETGQMYLANDDAFQKFLKEQKNRGRNVGELGSVLANNGSIKSYTTISRGYSSEERKAKAEEEVRNYVSQRSVPSYLKRFYEKGELIEGMEEEAKKAVMAEYSKSSHTKNVQLTREIRTGADFMAELQATDSAGNLIHDAADQLALIKQMGIFTDDLMTGIDTTVEGWEAQVVENFYAKVEEDKEEIEAVTESIRDQELAALDDAAAMQEINEKIRELTKPIGGITKSLEKWYNESVKIKEVQQEINKLVKEMDLLQKDQKINGAEIYENLKEQEASLIEQNAKYGDLIEKRQKEAKILAETYKDLPIEIDKHGAATFSEQKIGAVNGYGSINTSYTRSKTIKVGDQEYLVDTKGNYRDSQGVLRNSRGEEIEGNFGEQAVETITGHQAYNFANKTIQEIVADLTSKDAYGNWKFQGEEAFQILQAAGLEKYMQYDENGNKVYDDFGALTPEEMKKAAEAGVSRLQTAVEKVNENTDAITDLQEKTLDNNSKLLEIQQQLIDNQIEVEKMVKDAVEQLHQDAIDTKKDLKDALNDASTRTIDGLRDTLSEERAMYDKANDENQLATLQRQLEVAQRSGASMAKIQSLQEQVASAQKDMYFTEREELIDNIENSMQREIEALETQISIMEATFEYQKENGLLWAEINEVLKNTPAAIIDFINQNTPTLISASETDRLNQLITIGDKVELFKSYQEKRDKANDEQKAENQRLKAELETIKQEKEQDGGTLETQEPTKAHGSQEDREIRPEDVDIELEIDPNEVFDDIIDLDGLDLTLDQSILDNWYNSDWNTGMQTAGVSSLVDRAKKLANKTKGVTADEAVYALTLKYDELASNHTQSEISDIWKNMSDKDLKALLQTYIKKAFSKTVKFAGGGSIDFTGPAWVDGTKNEPEHIFNFQQMEALRAHLLNGVDVTRQAISGLSDALNQMPNINTYNSINNTTDSGVSIGTLEFHMEVSEISNDYDARRAGEQAMNEIVRIARKSGTRSLSRR